jgi:hypothetical protein
MARWTPEEWAAIKNPLSGGEAFNGRYWWLTKTTDGVTAAHDPTAATFGAVVEHDSQTVPGGTCAVEVIATNRTPDVGFTGTNVIQVGGFRDPIVCPICGLSGRIQNRAWVGT